MLFVMLLVMLLVMLFVILFSSTAAWCEYGGSAVRLHNEASTASVVLPIRYTRYVYRFPPQACWADFPDFGHRDVLCMLQAGGMLATCLQVRGLGFRAQRRAVHAAGGGHACHMPTGACMCGWRCVQLCMCGLRWVGWWVVCCACCRRAGGWHHVSCHARLARMLGPSCDAQSFL
jgi:hypothetical protein